MRGAGAPSWPWVTTPSSVNPPYTIVGTVSNVMPNMRRACRDCVITATLLTGIGLVRSNAHS